MSSGQGLGRRLGDVLAAVRDIAAQPVAALPDAVVSAELATLRELADAAEAAYLSMPAAFHVRGLGRADGLSTRAWLRSTCGVSPAEATRAIKTAAGLAQLPRTAAALTQGVVRPGHAAAMVDAATMLGTEVICAVEPALIQAATHLDPTGLRTALRGYGAAVDNPAAVRAAEHRAESRWLDVATTVDGALAVQGLLGAEDGALVQAALGPLAKPAGTNDPRTAAQRRADALTQLCRHQLGCGQLPSHGGEPTHLTVVTTLETIERRLATDAADSIDAAAAPTGHGGYGQLSDGSILRGETVRRMACDAKITRLIVGPDSMPLDVAAPDEASPRPSAKRYGCATTAVSSPAATVPPTGATHTTSTSGPSAAGPTSTSSPCSAASTTPWCTRAAGASCSPAPGDFTSPPRTARSSDPNAPARAAPYSLSF